MAVVGIALSLGMAHGRDARATVTWESGPLARRGMAILAMALRAQDPPAPPSGTTPPAIPVINVPEGEALVLELQDPLNTRFTRKGDTANLQVTADVFAEGKIAIPRSSIVRATITEAKRAGRVFGKARLRLQFDHLTLPDGTSYPIFTELSPSGWWEPTGDMKAKGDGGPGRDLKKVGQGAAQGALIGVLISGRSGRGKGAATGAAAGAAGTALAVMLERGPELDLPPGMMFEVQLTKPLAIPRSSIGGQEAETSILVPEETPAGPRTEEMGESVIAATVTPHPETSPAVSEPPATPPAPAEPAPAAAEVIPPPGAPARTPADPPAISETAGTYTLHVKVNLVLVETTVRDNRGAIVDNLKRGDFNILEDGAPQQVSHFSRDELPLAVAIVVDRSGSVEPMIEKLRGAALETLSLLKPDDQVALFAFDSKSDRLEYLTTDRPRIAAAIGRIRAGGGTNITDAVFDAALYLGRAAPSRRHAIVLVSDNQETVRGFASASDVVRLALETETTVYSIRIDSRRISRYILAPDIRPGTGSVNKMTRETGGEVFEAYDGGSIKNAMGAVISRLKKRYTLGYVSSNPNQDGKFREISVQLKKDSPAAMQNHRIFARRGYYAPLARTATAKTQ